MNGMIYNDMGYVLGYFSLSVEHLDVPSYSWPSELQVINSLTVFSGSLVSSA